MVKPRPNEDIEQRRDNVTVVKDTGKRLVYSGPCKTAFDVLIFNKLRFSVFVFCYHQISN